MSNKLEQAPAIQMMFKALRAAESQSMDDLIDPASLQTFNSLDAKPSFSTNPLDLRRQKQLKAHAEIVNTMTDDFDQLTNNVKVKKLEELIRRKNAEQRENAQKDQKQHQSTAYRPTNYPKPVMPAADGGPRVDGDNNDMAPGSGALILNDNPDPDYEVLDGHNQPPKFDGRDVEPDMGNENHSDVVSFGVGADDIPGHEKMPSNSEERHRQDGPSGRRPRHKSAEIDDGLDTDFNDEAEIFGEDVPEAGQAQNASHAECIVDLSYTKFKWNLDEDFTRFHRPDIQALFDQERELIRMNKE